MKRRGSYLLLKNTAANVVRGGATAAVALLLPRFLTRSLDTPRFAAWSLILQIAAYAGFLDFGLQTAVARFVANAEERGDRLRRQGVVSTALLLLCASAVVALLIVGLCIAESRHLFTGIPGPLQWEFSQAALLLTLFACLQLPLSTYTGVLTGLQRNEVPALAIGISRIIGAFACIVAVQRTRSLPVLALCIGLPNLIGGLVQRGVAMRALSHVVGFRHFSRAVAREMVRFCGGVTITSLSMLIIGGLDVTIVAHFNFEAVGPYAIAGSLITFVSGLTYAGLNALLAPVTSLDARGDYVSIQRVLFTTTALVAALNTVLSLCLVLFGGVLLRLWVGPAYALQALPILLVLVLAQLLRLLMAPYGIMLVAIGSPERAISAAIVEAMLNLTASIVGARLFGPLGVALGTLLGALGGVAWYLLRVLPRTDALALSASRFLRSGVLPGVLPCVPLAAYVVVHGRLAHPLLPLAMLTSLLCAAALARYSMHQLAAASHAD